MVNLNRVCFGAKDDGFGKFHIGVGGTILAFKLVHVSGSVSCKYGVFTKWGCNPSESYIQTVLTNSSDVIIVPESQRTPYTLNGYHSDSQEIVFPVLTNPMVLASGQELRLWYGEDLADDSESNNGGTTCADVYAKYK